MKQSLFTFFFLFSTKSKRNIDFFPPLFLVVEMGSLSTVCIFKEIFLASVGHG